jgi:hypothetical protein
MSANRLVLAKVELAEACERRDAADLDFRAAANRGDLPGTSAAWKRKQAERATVVRLVREIGELEAREAGLLAAFGPGAEV